MPNTFPIVILIGRPAAGKSEVIDFLKHQRDEERRGRFHIAPLSEIDDFVWVWETFEDDNIRARHGKPRQDTDENLFFLDPFIWNLYIEKINLEFKKRLARDANYLRDHTTLIEFARGGEDGFAEAFSYLDDEILERGVIAYIRVTYDESVRRNRKRARKGEEDSILYHSLPDEKMEFYYKVNDWEKLSRGQSTGLMDLRGHRVPFAVFENLPEKTDDAQKLGQELQRVTDHLWQLAQANSIQAIS
jgi:hypothetical protein